MSSPKAVEILSRNLQTVNGKKRGEGELQAPFVECIGIDFGAY